MVSMSEGSCEVKGQECAVKPVMSAGRGDFMQLFLVSLSCSRAAVEKEEVTLPRAGAAEDKQEEMGVGMKEEVKVKMVRHGF